MRVALGVAVLRVAQHYISVGMAILIILCLTVVPVIIATMDGNSFEMALTLAIVITNQ